MLKIVQGSRTWQVPAQPERKLMDVLREQGIALPLPCGGTHRCGKCRVRLEDARVCAPGEAERRLLTEAELADGVRLACCLPAGAYTVRVPEEAEAQLLADPPRADRQGEGASREDAAACARADALGIAIDVGTTTVAVALVDRRTGETLATCGALNAQKAYGADVMTRMQYALEHAEGAQVLREAICQQLGALCRALCAQAGIAPEAVGAAALVGNTVMMHLLLGLPTVTLARLPFEAVTLTYETVEASAIGLPLRAGARCALCPSAAAFVGGDIVAGVLETGLHAAEGLHMLIDIGTNGEMVLGNRDRLLCCATAAGPAFEGAHIACGVGGVAGAIRRFALDDAGQPRWETIGDAPPVGLCGAGLADVVAALLRAGVLDETGILEESPYPIAEGVYLTGADVREVQLAKAAIAAGITALLAQYGARHEQVEAVYIAGGLGNALDWESALRIGLLPAAFSGKGRSVGNTAIAGAVRLLADPDALATALGAASRMVPVELSTDACFQQQFIEEMLFPEE